MKSNHNGMPFETILIEKGIDGETRNQYKVITPVGEFITHQEMTMKDFYRALDLYHKRWEERPNPSQPLIIGAKK